MIGHEVEKLMGSGRWAVLAMLIAAFWPQAAAAQQDDRYPLWNFQQIRPARPAPPPRVERRRAPAYSSEAPSRPVVVRDTPERPAVEVTTFVAVIGDSMADMLATGLVDAFSESSEVLVSRQIVGSSGLVRTDFFDWRQGARDLLAANEKLTHAIVLIGSNDRQPIRDPSGTVLDPLSEPWRAAYSARIDEIARLFAERRVRLTWVGLPIMEGQRMAADSMVLNELFRAGARRNSLPFVDLWESFADANNRYTPTGPDLNGDTVRLRAGDGVHFTRLGARKAAHFVEVEIRRAMEGRAPANIVAVPADASDPASSDPALQPGGIERVIDQVVLRGLDGLPPVAIVIPQRPLAGPILPLTVPDTSGGGLLAAGPARRATTEAGLMLERTLVEGRMPDAKPGRADDFRWPVK